MKLGDTGKEVQISLDKLDKQREHPEVKEVKVIMVIKAPRGICRIFESHYTTWNRCQSEAIKAFVREHLHD